MRPGTGGGETVCFCIYIFVVFTLSCFTCFLFGNRHHRHLSTNDHLTHHHPFPLDATNPNPYTNLWTNPYTNNQVIQAKTLGQGRWDFVLWNVAREKRVAEYMCTHHGRKVFFFFLFESGQQVVVVIEAEAVLS